MPSIAEKIEAAASEVRAWEEQQAANTDNVVFRSSSGAPCAGCRGTTFIRRRVFSGVILPLCAPCDDQAGKRHNEIVAAIEGALRR
jgi:hypothetical protein